MRRVYIETSVWSMIGPEQDHNLREPTVAFLDQCAARLHMPYVSPIVLEEISQAPEALQQLVVAKMDEVNPTALGFDVDSDKLASRFIEAGVLPSRRIQDARHVAAAMVNGLDLLVSWNYKHIANVRRAEAFNAVAVLSGLRHKLEIHTPLEVLEWE